LQLKVVANITDMKKLGRVATAGECWRQYAKFDGYIGMAVEIRTRRKGKWKRIHVGFIF